MGPAGLPSLGFSGQVSIRSLGCITLHALRELQVEGTLRKDEWEASMFLSFISDGLQLTSVQNTSLYTDF